MPVVQTGDTPRRLGASLNNPSQTLPGRFHGQPQRRCPRTEGRCLTLDGVIRATTASGIAVSVRACTTSATGTRETLTKLLRRGRDGAAVVDTLPCARMNYVLLVASWTPGPTVAGRSATARGEKRET